jgi:hypothetical protein
MAIFEEVAPDLFVGEGLVCLCEFDKVLVGVVSGLALCELDSVWVAVQERIRANGWNVRMVSDNLRDSFL